MQKEGYLNKKGVLTWKKRWFVLSPEKIVYYSKQGDKNTRGELALNDSSKVSTFSGKPFALQVISNNRALIVAANSTEEQTEWKTAIKNVLSGLKERTYNAHGRTIRVVQAAGSEFHLDSKYRMIKPIGHGAYGVVISAENTETGEKVAIKKITDAFNDLVDAKRIAREIRLLRQFEHENIIGCSDLFCPAAANNFEDVYIISELMVTDLHRVIYHQPLTDEHIQYITYQILCGLKYIHSAAVLHRDLKPSNILLNGNCDVKLCDFGLSRAVDPEEQPKDLTEYIVTRWYRAPEIILAAKCYTKAIDVWAVGCILGEMLGRKPLFPGKDYLEQLRLICRFIGNPTEEDLDFVYKPRAKQFMLSLPACEPVDLQAHFSEAEDLSADGLDLLRRMLVLNPARRVSVDEALAHPYMAAVHDPALEVEATGAVSWEDIEQVPLTKTHMQRKIMEEVVRFRPEGQGILDSLVEKSSDESANQSNSAAAAAEDAMIAAK